MEGVAARGCGAPDPGGHASASQRLLPGCLGWWMGVCGPHWAALQHSCPQIGKHMGPETFPGSRDPAPSDPVVRASIPDD